MHVPPPKDLVIPSGLKGKYRSPCFSFSTTTIAPGAATAEFHTSTLYRESISLFCLNFILSAAQEKYTTDLCHSPSPPSRRHCPWEMLDFQILFSHDKKKFRFVFRRSDNFIDSIIINYSRHACRPRDIDDRSEARVWGLKRSQTRCTLRKG